MPSRASAIPEFDTMPPVVSSSGSLSISRPAPIGCESGTGRASTSTTQEPTTTQSRVFSMCNAISTTEIAKCKMFNAKCGHGDDFLPILHFAFLILHFAFSLLLRQLLFYRGEDIGRIGLCPRR